MVACNLTVFSYHGTALVRLPPQKFCDFLLSHSRENGNPCSAYAAKKKEKKTMDSCFHRNDREGIGTTERGQE